MSTVISTRNTGFWKGALQLAVPPAACTARATPAKTKNDANTPAPYTKPSVRTRRGCSFAC